jgi:AGZA family xanthine/uracil permease-like MFS transporter
VDDPVYLTCKADVRRQLITTTAAVAALSSFLMGLFANLPVALAPGLGLNAYVSRLSDAPLLQLNTHIQFAYSVVGFHGSGKITYSEALAATFLEGWLFFIMSLLGMRQWLARVIPNSLVQAVGAGIGCFIAFIGLRAYPSIYLNPRSSIPEQNLVV